MECIAFKGKRSKEKTGLGDINNLNAWLGFPFVLNRMVIISASLAFGPRSCANTANASVGSWPSGSAVCFTPMLFPEVLNAKQGNSMYS